jgi:protein-tyrosine-phosphatase
MDDAPVTSSRSFIVLFVCTGNQCRSPMAQALFENLIKHSGDGDLRADSAGTSVYNIYTPIEEAVVIAQEHGLNITGIRSKPCTAEQINEADLVLTMGKMHQAFIVNTVPSSKDKTFLLTSFGRSTQDPKYDTEIEDPIGGEPEDYRLCFETLDREVRRVYPLIRRWIRTEPSNAP